MISPELFSGLYFFFFFSFEGGCYEKEEKLRLLHNLNHFSEILAVLNLCGSFVRLTEFELRCEIYYVNYFKFLFYSLWPLRFVARLLIGFKQI